MKILVLSGSPRPNGNTAKMVQAFKRGAESAGDYVTVSCENGRLVITPDTESSAVKQAEAEFMEREMEALQKRFETEKAKIHERFVAERQMEYSTVAESGAGYGI